MREYIARRFPLNLQLFAEDPNNNPDPNPNPNPDPDPNKGKTFTQAELDAAVQSRLSRAEKDAKKALAKELGFDSVEAMQAAMKKDKGSDKKDSLDPAEVEKLLDERIKEREKEQNQKTFNRLLNAEVKVLANELGFADWEDALALGNFSNVKEDDRGDLEGVREAMEDLSKRKPHLLKQKPGSGSFGADVRGGGSPDDKRKALDRMAELAKKEGTHTVAANDPWGRK